MTFVPRHAYEEDTTFPNYTVLRSLNDRWRRCRLLRELRGKNLLPPMKFRGGRLILTFPAAKKEHNSNQVYALIKSIVRMAQNFHPMDELVRTLRTKLDKFKKYKERRVESNDSSRSWKSNKSRNTSEYQSRNRNTSNDWKRQPDFTGTCRSENFVRDGNTQFRSHAVQLVVLESV